MTVRLDHFKYDDILIIKYTNYFGHTVFPASRFFPR